MLDDSYETLRDVLRQIAVHDASSRLRAAAERCLYDATASMRDVMAAAVRSPYERKLLRAYAAVLVLEAA